MYGSVWFISRPQGILYRTNVNNKIRTALGTHKPVHIRFTSSPYRTHTHPKPILHGQWSSNGGVAAGNWSPSEVKIKWLPSTGPVYWQFLGSVPKHENGIGLHSVTITFPLLPSEDPGQDLKLSSSLRYKYAFYLCNTKFCKGV
jgi:hypothetical protein